MKIPDKPLLFATRDDWRAWLETHHTTEAEAWLIHYKKSAKKQSVAYEEAVEEALCFGWIDGLMQGIDGEKFAQRYSPRKRNSIWSETNRRRVARLIDAGRMTAAGLARVEEAQANGQWAAAGAREDTSAVPPDLERALRRRKGAWAAFQAWPPSRKKIYMHWVNSAKRPETREKRVKEMVEMVMGERPLLTG